MKYPLVSVIIPTYNEEKYIKNCLNSLKNQHYSNSEIIIVDDGSLDNTFKILKNYEVNSYKVNHMGMGYCRNYGFTKSTGKILCFLART